MLFGGDLRKMVYLQKKKKRYEKGLEKVWFSTKHVKQLNGASYWCMYHCQEYKENTNVTLKCLEHSHLNKVTFSHLNISSIRNKSGDLD